MLTPQPPLDMAVDNAGANAGGQAGDLRRGLRCRQAGGRRGRHSDRTR
jgi:hypothetical protein